MTKKLRSEEIQQLADQLRSEHPSKSKTELAKLFKEAYPDYDISENTLRLYCFNDGSEEKLKEDILERTETTQELSIDYKGEQCITSLQQAIKYFEIDTDVWEVASFKTKSWDTTMKIVSTIGRGKKQIKVSKPVKKTNYAVSVTFKRKAGDVDYKAIYNNLKHFLKENSPLVINTTPGHKVGVACITDIHIGASGDKEQGLINLKDFNLEQIVSYLEQIANIINERRYKEVHIGLLGDLVESISGHNHIETLKSMETNIWGGTAILTAYEVIRDFLGKINNLKKVYVVSGNHDRLTQLKEQDRNGGAAQIVAYMLNQIIPTEWHSILISKVIDNINYIFTHGHMKFAKNDLGKIFFEYGNNKYYNVLAMGHFHTRSSTKLFMQKETIPIDTQRYRALIVSPLFTGIRYSEENGYSGAAGFSLMEANSKKDNIHHFDFSF